jgi:hypothetical protein
MMKDRPGGPLRPKGTGPKNHYVQKGPVWKAIMFKRDQAEVPLRPEGTSPKVTLFDNFSA